NKEKFLRVPRNLEQVSVIVDAFDQNEGNLARRRLGLYQLGYQVLHSDGTPLSEPISDFKTPRITIKFNWLPTDEEAVKVAYFEQSGITVHGNSSTRFLYNLTNEIFDGHARTGFWNIKSLAAGDYLLRIYAADYAGNVASKGRDLALRLE
ncbi:MAG: gluconolaconase, partial [Undibacterium sp.]|nr:gluconolaconase [Undibacterium sp.]